MRRKLAVSSMTPGVRRMIRPGDECFVFDLESGLFVSTSPVVFRGETIAPITARLLSLTWPIEADFGVYVFSNEGTPEVLDVSDWVAAEGTAAWWTVGDWKPESRGTYGNGVLGGTDGDRKMYVGYPDTTDDEVRVVADDGDLLLQSVTGDVILNDGLWGNVSALPTAWTNITTWSNSWANYGGSWQTAQYRKHMDKVELRGLARNDGTVAAFGTIFTLPVGYRPPAQLIFPVQAHFVGGITGADDDHQSRITVYPSGIVRLEVTVDTGASWLSLNISFSVTA
jgi:hypothetical protein